MILEILTPEKKLFSDEVYGVQLPGVEGQFELLEKHAPIVAALGQGTIKVIANRSFTDLIYYNIQGGFVEMLNNKATVLAEGVVAAD